MVLKDKKKRIQASRYLRKKNRATKVTEREAKQREGNITEGGVGTYYEEEDLPHYDSNDDFLIKDKKIFSYILKSEDELKERRNDYSTVHPEKDYHKDSIFLSIAFNIPLGMM
ncbi:conserved Plasmodium protein, unknown function [Plasmodium ovale curtisi]|uniref:Uncharacterized protein n=1 Tax=Plasmodium ovale curtisi TaxID=864141 RepID=A0A1A8VU02_PLAOA|nr:conserved Plasmodium protein, unknown function [Plasmodium ovale curtisi]SBS87537.1 conserved Plasmodium protein, unknown function [Plasmodium ovale curtisi]